MTDRELLEAAAKAAGITLEYRRGSDAHYYDDPETGREQWAPLDNDGQALRLAVKLGLHISQQLSYCVTFCPHGDNSTRGTTWTEQYNTDPAAATRRAIVRAAAAIGGAR